ncbi:MAG TPA: TIGR02594 family protein [Gemmatimonadales bacterium]|nr:TIGR02594 family protein [Gemmatimonadales bacterium]
MPAKKTGYTGPWIKDDEIQLDTSSTPWMDVAKAELAKKIKEQPANDALVNQLRDALAQHRLEESRMQQFRDFPQNSKLLGSGGGAMDPRRYRLYQMPDIPNRLLGEMEVPNRAAQNPEIVKYFEGVTTNPLDDRKGRVWDLAPTYEAGGRAQVTAWCAAFVNWCLAQAGCPRLGLGTARAWLDFGTPLLHPTYGCITVIRPSSSTGSTTGHVAFFLEKNGAFLKLLGGNQGDKVCEMLARETTVLGYRWPTNFNHYLQAAAGAGIVT